MTDEWYLLRDDEQFGPYTWEEIWEHKTAGNIAADDLLWNESMEDWQPACQIPGLIFDDDSGESQASQENLTPESTDSQKQTAGRKSVHRKIIPWKVIIGDELPSMPFGKNELEG